MTNKTILAIDDDKRNIFALSSVLRSRGYKCLTALNMQDAFEILSGETPVHIVLIDMMMPEMDGYEAIPKIKAGNFKKELPVIAVTAQAMAGDKERCLAAGADDYISKPVDVDVLLSVLDQHLK